MILFVPPVAMKFPTTLPWIDCCRVMHVVSQLRWCCASPSPAFILSCCGDRSHQPGTGSTWSQLNESSVYTKHSQRAQTSLNSLLFFLCCLPLLCHLCHLWSTSGWVIVVFTFLYKCLVGWVLFWCIDAWVHRVRVSRGHLVLFSSAGGWPGHLLPDDWIGLWCGFDSYSGATLSSDRSMCGTVCVCICSPPPHLVPPNPFNTHAGSKCTQIYGHVCLIKWGESPLYFTE